MVDMVEEADRRVGRRVPPLPGRCTDAVARRRECGRHFLPIILGKALPLRVRPVMLPFVYRALTWPLPPLALLYLRRRQRRGKEDGARLGERRGLTGTVRPPGPLLWIHAASVGEATAMLRLIERLLETRPELEILVTTGTVASARLLASRLPRRARHQFVPVDLPGWIGRFLDHWRPDMALVGRIRAVAQFGARDAGSRHSDDAGQRPVVGALVSALAPVARVDPPDARRLCGVPGAGCRAGRASAHARRARRCCRRRSESRRGPHCRSISRNCGGCDWQIGRRPLWLAASTHHGEEEIAAAAHRRLAAAHPGLLTIIAPRHPARGDMVAAMLAASGLRVARRSRGQPIAAETEIYLADTIGELGLFYRLAGIAFIGGSMTPKGGHNPFEAACLDCAILHGPDMSNCTAMAAALAAAGAAQTVSGVDELARAVSALLARSPAARRPLRRRRPRGRRRSGRSRRRPCPTVALARPARAGARRRERQRAGRRASQSAALVARMMRAAPVFWGEEAGLAADLLAPFGAAWDAAGRLRRALARPYRAPVPVICVGNLVAGGAGKTPVTLALADWLVANGVAVHIVTRGYGGRLAGPLRVDAPRHDAARSATRRCCSPRARPAGSPAIAPPVSPPRSKPAPRRSCSTTGFKTRRSPKRCRCSSSTPAMDLATGG